MQGLSSLQSRSVPLALPVLAFIGQGAGISVVAEVYVRSKHTSALRCTGVVGTDISIVADGFSCRHTGSALAGVICGAHIIVVAIGSIGHINVQALPGFGIASRRNRAGLSIVLAFLFQPWHNPPAQVSPWVQALPSSHGVPLSLGM